MTRKASKPAKKSASKAVRKPAKRGAAPTLACPMCRKTMKESRDVLRLRINGEEVAVRAAQFECPHCGELVLRMEDARRLQADAIASYRKKHGLLAADEIRAIRARLGVSQSELDRLLHLEAKTLARWEAGRNVQTEPLDVFLRLLRDQPDTLAYLREHAS